MNPRPNRKSLACNTPSLERTRKATHLEAIRFEMTPAVLDYLSLRHAPVACTEYSLRFAKFRGRVSPYSGENDVDVARRALIRQD